MGQLHRKKLLLTESLFFCIVILCANTRFWLLSPDLVGMPTSSSSSVQFRGKSPWMKCPLTTSFESQPNVDANDALDPPPPQKKMTCQNSALLLLQLV